MAWGDRCIEAGDAVVAVFMRLWVDCGVDGMFGCKSIYLSVWMTKVSG